MSINPWEVDSIREFYFLKCPECDFTHKEEKIFQNHAINAHPLSIPFFEKNEFAIEKIGNFDICNKENESNYTLITVKEEFDEPEKDYETSEGTFMTENDMNFIEKVEEIPCDEYSDTGDNNDDFEDISDKLCQKVRGQKGQRSKVWEHFLLNRIEEKVKCVHCSALLSHR